MSYKDTAIYLVCVLVCAAAGFAGNLASSPDSYVWYYHLNKSPLNPPNWVFGPAWTIIYIFMGSALFVVIKNYKNEFFETALSLFILQLLLNVLWMPIFFHDRMPFYAYIEILILDAVVLMTARAFGRISRTAQLLMLPYIVWLGFATYLNYYIMMNN